MGKQAKQENKAKKLFHAVKIEKEAGLMPDLVKIILWPVQMEGLTYGR